jgi:hypothetical protein
VVDVVITIFCEKWHFFNQKPYVMIKFLHNLAVSESKTPIFCQLKKSKHRSLESIWQISISEKQFTDKFQFFYQRPQVLLLLLSPFFNYSFLVHHTAATQYVGSSDLGLMWHFVVCHEQDAITRLEPVPVLTGLTSISSLHEAMASDF